MSCILIIEQFVIPLGNCANAKSELSTMFVRGSRNNPVAMGGLTIHSENPLQLEFLIDTGDSQLNAGALKSEAQKLINYFFAVLTTPEKELWVNLSPTEKDRIMADGLSKTEIGQDMLAQDLQLKQLTARLTNPETELGKEYWHHFNAALSKNIAGKVWIVPQRATVYVHGNHVFVVDYYLKVRMEQDSGGQRVASGSLEENAFQKMILPQIEKEVNEGKDFSKLRQIYTAMILATWYKNKLKGSWFDKFYFEKNKTTGIALDDPTLKQKIYDQYLAAFKRGAYSVVKEEVDEKSQELIPRRYFSGGLTAVSDIVESTRPSDDWQEYMANARLVAVKAQADVLSQSRSSSGVNIVYQNLLPHQGMSVLGILPNEQTLLETIIDKIKAQQASLGIVTPDDRAVFIKNISDGYQSRVFFVAWDQHRYIVKVSKKPNQNRFVENEWKILMKLNGDGHDQQISKPLIFGTINHIADNDQDHLSYIVTDFLDGQNLTDIVDDENPLDTGKLARLLINLANLVKRVHQQGVVIRDLKPDNVRMREDGDVELFDFDLSMVLGDSTDDLTSDVRILNVFAEEGSALDDNSQKIIPDQLSDIYSIGMILLFLASGDIYDFVEKHKIYKAFKKVQDQDVIKVIRRSIAPRDETDPATRRYQTVDELLLDLEKLSAKYSFSSSAVLEVRIQIEQLQSRLGELRKPTQEQIDDFLKDLDSGESTLAGEIVDVYDQATEDAKIIGQIDRRVATKLGYVVQTAEAFVLAPNGKLLFPLRVPLTKETVYPYHVGIYGGYVESGETHLKAVTRELVEELGLTRLVRKPEFFGFDFYDKSWDTVRQRKARYFYRLSDYEYRRIRKQEEQLSLMKNLRTEAEVINYLKTLNEQKPGTGESFGHIEANLEEMMASRQGVNPQSKNTDKGQHNRYIERMDPILSRDTHQPFRMFLTPDNLDLAVENEMIMGRLKNAIAFRQLTGIEVDQATGRIHYHGEPQVQLNNIELWAVRHGETLANLESVSGEKPFSGAMDEDMNQLTPLGKQQAQKAAEELYTKLESKLRAGQEVVVIMSPLRPASNTAWAFLDVVASKFKIPAFTHIIGNREVTYQLPDGEGGGKIHVVIDDRLKEMEFTESFLSVIKQTFEALTEYNQRFAGKSVILFGHATNLTAIRVNLGDQKLLDTQSKTFIDWREHELANAKPTLINSNSQVRTITFGSSPLVHEGSSNQSSYSSALNYAGRYMIFPQWLSTNRYLDLKTSGPAAVLDMGSSYGFATVDLAKSLGDINPQLQVYGVDSGEHVGQLGEDVKIPSNLVFIQDDYHLGHTLGDDNIIKEPIKVISAFNLVRWFKPFQVQEFLEYSKRHLSDGGLLVIGDGGLDAKYGLVFFVFQKVDGHLIPQEIILNRFGNYENTNHFEFFTGFFEPAYYEKFTPIFKNWAEIFEGIVNRMMIAFHDLPREAKDQKAVAQLAENIFKAQLNELGQLGVRYDSLSQGFVSIPLIQFERASSGVGSIFGADFTKGGIDFNPQSMDFKEKGSSSLMDFSFEQLKAINPQDIQGLMPVIINIAPVNNVPLLLGWKENKYKESDQLSYRDF